MAHIEKSTFFNDLRLTSYYYQMKALVILVPKCVNPNSIGHQVDFIQIPIDPKKIELFFTDTQNVHFQKNPTFLYCVLFQFRKNQSTLQVTPENVIIPFVEIP